MSNKSAAERTADAVRNANAIKNILKKFASGGWGAAAMEAVKHYWPQILAIGCSLILITLIIFCSFPLLIFGGVFSSDADDLSALNIYDNLEQRYSETVNEIVDSVKYPETEDSQNTKTNSSSQEQTESSITVSAVRTSGTVIQKYMFVALHTVYLGNSAEDVTEDSIKDFVKRCIDFETQTNEDDNSVIVNIKYLTADEVMEKLRFSESEKAWATNMYETLTEKGSV